MYQERIKRIRSELNLSVAKMAEKMKIPSRTFVSYESDGRTPSLDFFAQLCKTFNVNASWFISGNGEMFNNECENTHVLINDSNCLNRFKSWGDRLCNILSKNMITPKEFAKRAGINPERVENFILNSAEPTMAEINAIKSNIDVSIDELFYGEKVTGNNSVVQPQFTADEILKLKKLISS